jgi:Fe-S cluster assembly ATPase SufC
VHCCNVLFVLFDRKEKETKMCGPSKKQKAATVEAQQQQQQAAVVQQQTADEVLREEAERRAEVKAGDISQAVSQRAVRKGMSGGSGRRSLFSSSAAGFLGRFQ